DEALALAERIRGRVGRERFAIPTSVEPITATVSVGVATLGEHGSTVKELLHAADLALYRAKVEGRDRVRVASPEDDEQVPPAAPPHVAGDGFRHAGGCRRRDDRHLRPSARHHRRTRVPAARAAGGDAA